MLTTQSAATIADSMLAELETQTAVTRRFLERLPDDRLTWKPHERSMTAGQLAYHLASVPAAVARLAETNPAPAPKSFTVPQPASVKEILDTLDESLVTVRAVLPTLDDAAMAETWRLAVDGVTVLEQPRGVFLRNVMLSHWYQHRGQFSVYLRLLNIAVPASWGPSADESPQFLHKG